MRKTETHQREEKTEIFQSLFLLVEVLWNTFSGLEWILERKQFTRTDARQCELYCIRMCDRTSSKANVFTTKTKPNQKQAKATHRSESVSFG